MTSAEAGKSTCALAPPPHIACADDEAP